MVPQIRATPTKLKAELNGRLNSLLAKVGQVGQSTGRGLTDPPAKLGAKQGPKPGQSLQDRLDGLLARGVKEVGPKRNSSAVPGSASPGEKAVGTGAWVVTQGRLGDILGKNDKVIASFNSEAEARKYADQRNKTERDLGTTYSAVMRPDSVSASSPVIQPVGKGVIEQLLARWVDVGPLKATAKGTAKAATVPLAVAKGGDRLGYDENAIKKDAGPDRLGFEKSPGSKEFGKHLRELAEYLVGVADKSIEFKVKLRNARFDVAAKILWEDAAKGVRSVTQTKETDKGKTQRSFPGHGYHHAGKTWERV